MSLPRFSVNNTVLVNMLMVLILCAGSIFAVTLVREMFPESRPDKLMIMALNPGEQPDELQKSVTIKIEENVRDVDGVEKVDSVVNEGVSSTILTLYNDVRDVDAVLQEVKNEVDSIDGLDEVEQILINKFEPKLPVISVALFGDWGEVALKQAARNLRDDLLLLPGVSEVEINGIRADEIHVEVRQERLLKYDITFDELAQAIQQANLDVSGGDLKGDRATISVRTLGEEQRGVDLEEIVVRAQSDGRKVLLSDLAEIRDGFVDTDLESYFNGEPAVDCTVYKTRSQDAIQIADVVKAYVAGKMGQDFDYYGIEATKNDFWLVRPFTYTLANISAFVTPKFVTMLGRPDPMVIYKESLNKPFQHNFKVALHTNLARFIEGRIDLMTRNGKSGLILVLISLNLFLNWRVAFWAAIGLPVSFLGTFIVMWAFGSTINLLTLFGLIIVLGIIVDDAIVIGENIYRHYEEGLPARQAAIVGAEEVMWPVTVAVLTTIAAFAPLLFIKGRIGDFMGQLPIVVLAALSVSLIEALVILPAHLAHLPPLQPVNTQAKNTHAFARFIRFQEQIFHDYIVATYERFIRFALQWRYVTLAVAVSSLSISFGLYHSGIVDQVFIQKMDSETLICALEMPIGTTSDQVEARLKVLSDAANQAPEVVNVQMFVARQYNISGDGAAGNNDQSHLGQLVIELLESGERDSNDMRSSEELLSELRALSKTLTGVNSITWEALSGGPSGKDVHIQLIGDNLEELADIAESIKDDLSGYEGVFDLDDDFDKGKREVQLRLLESARPTGIDTATLGLYVRSALYGRESKRVTRNREDVRIMVRYPKEFRKNVYNLETMWVPTKPVSGKRGWVPLGQVAELTDSTNYSTIHRSQQQRAISIYADVDDEITSTTEITEKIAKGYLEKIQPEHPNVRIEFLGTAEEMQKSFSGLWTALPVALILIYTLLAALFRSYFQPLVVMSAIPFAFQGAVIGHLLTNNPFTFLSWIGMVALTGIVVNDSLVLVDFINSRIRRGLEPFEATVVGTKLRLRAILLTTLTTVAGLTPLMFETSFQAKFLIPMAVTLTFGLVFATILTLIVVPTLNMIFFDICALLRFRPERVITETTTMEQALTTTEGSDIMS